jgi:hypothetical protein
MGKQLLATIDELFVLQEKNLTFLFLGECSIQQQKGNLAVVERMNFELGLRRNGTILGKLDMVLEQNRSLEEIRAYFSDAFNLIGLDHKTGLPIIMESCFITSWEKPLNDKEISCIYSALDVVLGKDNLTSNLSGMIKFHFGLTNVFRIKNIYSPFKKIIFGTKDRVIGECDLSDINKVILTTALGKLEFYNYANIDEDEKIMRNFKIPLITAGISIECLKNNHNVDLECISLLFPLAYLI